MGISCPLKQSPESNGGDSVSGAGSAGAAGETRGMGSPHQHPGPCRHPAAPAPCSPSTLPAMGLGRGNGSPAPTQPCTFSNSSRTPSMV